MKKSYNVLNQSLRSMSLNNTYKMHPHCALWGIEPSIIILYSYMFSGQPLTYPAWNSGHTLTVENACFKVLNFSNS